MATLGPADPARRSRIESVDALRGIIMTLMALDHTRDFFGVPGANPVDLSRASAALFLTRWVTHFCAPVFFLLTGTGAYLSLKRTSQRELSQFLFTRGLWLIFLELVVTRGFGWQFNFDYRVTMLLVLWALGWAMMVLSGLLYLPASLVIAFGLVLIAGHNLFDSASWSNPFWSILHVPGFALNTPQHAILVAYPLIPWIGVTAVGYGLGRIYAWTPEKRSTFLLRLGLCSTACFLVLRFVNRYGDSFPWSAQKSGAFTALSFLNTTKYPPSLLYLLMTLGPALLLLWALNDGIPQFLRPALAFGKVPMFYYLLHIPLVHIVAIIVCYARYGRVYWMFESSTPGQFPVTPPPGWGFGLPIVYLIWIGVVLALYPLCSWFADLKRRRSDAWLSYF
jgi:uncharacterized membrane protein